MEDHARLQEIVQNTTNPNNRRTCDERLNEIETQMQKTVDFLSEQLRGFQTDNVSIAMIETVRFQYHGQATPIKYLASITQEGRRITIQVYDPHNVGGIVKCLSDSGLVAYKFSKNIVIVNVPLPSGEQKDKAMKKMKELGEETKVALRNLRKKAKKQGIEENDLNGLIAKYVAKVDEMIGS